MGGGGTPGKMIDVLDDDDIRERNYSFDTMLRVRARNPRITYR